AISLVWNKWAVLEFELHEVSSRIFLKRRHHAECARSRRRELWRHQGNFFGLRKTSGCVLYLENGHDICNRLVGTVHNRTADRNRLTLKFVRQHCQTEGL